MRRTNSLPWDNCAAAETYVPAPLLLGLFLATTTGSRHPMEVFKAFRGREPSTEALLRHTGLAAAAAAEAEPEQHAAAAAN